MSTTIDRIEQQIRENPVLIFMKGSPDFPQCGFSARAVDLLKKCHVQFKHVDVLSNPAIRQELPLYANWPTFPQLWVNGELLGGCDIMTEMFSSGELQKLFDNIS